MSIQAVRGLLWEGVATIECSDVSRMVWCLISIQNLYAVTIVQLASLVPRPLPD